MMKDLHHNAYPLPELGGNTGVLEEVLGLRLVSAFEIDEGRRLHASSRSTTAPASPSSKSQASPSSSSRRSALDFLVASGSSLRSSTVCWTRRRARAVRSADRSTTVCPVDLFSRSHRLCHRIDGQHRVHQEMVDPAISKPRDSLARWRAARPIKGGNHGDIHPRRGRHQRPRKGARILRQRARDAGVQAPQ